MKGPKKCPKCGSESVRQGFSVAKQVRWLEFACGRKAIRRSGEDRWKWSNRPTYDCFERLLAQAEEREKGLRKIVDRLPKTADGAIVVDGDEVYHPAVGDKAMFGVHVETRVAWVWGDGPNEGAHLVDGVGECYSTREAADAVSEKGDGRMTQAGIGEYEATWRELFWTPDPPTIDGVCEKLGREMRYFSHGRVGLSVAEHSMLVAQAVMPGLRLKALLHDAGEAYTGDVPAPLKRMFSGLAEWCQGIQAETVLALGSQPPTAKEAVAIKMADRLAFVAEVRFLFEPKRAADFILAEIDADGPLNLEAAEALVVYGFGPCRASNLLLNRILFAREIAEKSA